MKHIILFTFFFLLLSCTGRSQWQCGGSDPIKSTFYDKRCRKIQEEARKKREESGFCYISDEVMMSSERAKLHPDPEKCLAIGEEARKKCDALGPPGPGDLVYTSGSATYRGGKPVIVNGKPVCP